MCTSVYLSISWGCKRKFGGVLLQQFWTFARLVDAALSHMKCGRDAVACGVCIQQRRAPLYLLTNVMVVVAAHTPPGGGGRSLRRGPTPKRVPHRVPTPTIRLFCRFVFHITASWGAQSHNAVVLSRFVFHRVPNPGTLFVMVVCYCVSRGTASCMHFALGRKTT